MFNEQCSAPHEKAGMIPFPFRSRTHSSYFPYIPFANRLRYHQDSCIIPQVLHPYQKAEVQRYFRTEAPGNGAAH